MRDFLIRIAVLKQLFLATAKGDDRAATEIRVLQTGGEVRGAD